jgi:MFS family permease
MLGFSIGPLLGGALTHITGWRVIFWLNALLMLVALAGMASAGSATMRPDGTRGRRVDWVGFILLATFMSRQRVAAAARPNGLPIAKLLRSEAAD